MKLSVCGGLNRKYMSVFAFSHVLNNLYIIESEINAFSSMRLQEYIERREKRGVEKLNDNNRKSMHCVALQLRRL